MNSTIDIHVDPGELLHAVLEGWVVAEISDATVAKKPPLPLPESHRGRGIQSVRGSGVSGCERFKAVR